MNKKKIIIAKTKYFLRKSKHDNISAIAAQSAFFLILSVVPFLMFAFSVLSFFNIPKELYETYLKQALSGELGMKVQSFIDSTYSSSIGIAFTTIIVALWSAGKGLYSITDGINRIYKINYNKIWIIKRIYAMGYTILMFFVMVLTVLVLVIFEFFDDQIKPLIKNLPYVVELLYTLRYFVLFAVLLIVMSFALKFYLGSKVKDKRWTKFRLQLPGVILINVCWIVLAMGIRIYVKYFNGFSLYGSLTTIAIFMVWIYFSMYILLYGIQFNYINRYEIYEFRIRNLFRRKKLTKSKKRI